MTKEEFKAKFPDAEKRENCLTDLACPNCGQRDGLKIEVSTLAYLNEDGFSDTYDMEYDGDNYCRCPRCEHVGKVSDFTIEGLDENL
jgi:DNA-directed RNA polymerase subunit RPC12/RpoP